MLIFKKVKKSDLNEIYSMLQDISKFTPKKSEVSKIWNNYTNQTNCHSYSFYLDKTLIGYGLFITEYKIRGGVQAHIEDIVVKKEFRGKDLGLKIIKILTEKAKEMGCYKVSLSCKDHNINFYRKCGFDQTGINMTLLI